MSDTERILEAIAVLTQRVDNLHIEVSGLRTDVRAYDADLQAHKKKATRSRMSFMAHWLRWPG